MMIARAMTSNSHTLASEDERFVGACVQRALVHDLEEARSGDFPRPFKYSDPKLKEVLDNLGGVAFGQCFIKVLQDFTARTSLEKLWREAKDDTPEGHVVKFADFLSAFVFIYMESHNGNKRFRSQIGSEINLYSELFRADPYRDMAPWVDEVQEMLKEIE
jgi:5'-deoxynucleotidase YfbR-like HD superfamily hydrolase